MGLAEWTREPQGEHSNLGGVSILSRRGHRYQSPGTQTAFVYIQGVWLLT